MLICPRVIRLGEIWTTHTASVASPAWLWLNLQKLFQRVSTRVNWRLTITSSMAWQEGKEKGITQQFSSTLKHFKFFVHLQFTFMPCLLHDIMKLFYLFSSFLSLNYLTVFSVEQLKALYVIQFDTLGRGLPLEVNIWELGKCSGCIWPIGHMARKLNYKGHERKVICHRSYMIRRLLFTAAQTK